MTTLNVALSTKLQKTLGQAGVWAEAVYFDTAGTAHWTPLVNDGTVQGNLAIDLPQMKGGKVYFLINSGTAGQTTSPLQSVITKESDISIASAQANDFRFDSFEFTLQGDPSDQGNMTSVVGFGIPMGVSIKYQDPAKPVATLGYNTSGADLFKAIQAIHPDSTSLVFGFSAGPLATASPAVYRYAVSPSNSAQVTDPPFAASDWNAYLGDLLATGGTVGRLSGIFNGAADANGIWHNQGFFNYTITVDYSGQSIVPLLTEIMESATPHELTALLSKAALGAHYLHLQQQFGKSLQPGNTVHDTLDQVTHTPDSLQASLAQLHSATMAELV